MVAGCKRFHSAAGTSTGTSTPRRVTVCEPSARKASRISLKRAFGSVTEEATLVESVNLRRSHRLKLRDAMIWASARIHGWQLVTRNTKDFPPEWANGIFRDKIGL